MLNSGLADATLDEIRLALAPAIAANAGFDGWGDDARDLAADAVGVDRDVARLAFPGGAVEMIDAWFASVDAAMLAQALCKLEGFTYEPSDSVYWQQGHSSESDFLYVTTQTLGPEELAALSDEVGEGRSLLILCAAFRGNAELWANLTLRKIPNHIRSKCEWGHDDYSLNVANLPMAEKAPPSPSPAQSGLFEGEDEA